jgi:hypothetical protein
MKERAITGGGLARHGLTGEKSAEVIVVTATSFSGERKAGQRRSLTSVEGLNVRVFSMR